MYSRSLRGGKNVIVKFLGSTNYFYKSVLNNTVKSGKVIHKANVTDFKVTSTQTVQVTQLAGTNA